MFKTKKDTKSILLYQTNIQSTSIFIDYLDLYRYVLYTCEQKHSSLSF